MLLCESSIAALYTDFKHGGVRHQHVRTALEQERLAVPPESEYAREIEDALKSLDEVFTQEVDVDEILPRRIRSRGPVG